MKKVSSVLMNDGRQEVLEAGSRALYCDVRWWWRSLA